MQIGLFDLDLWYSHKGFPNLELMKTYNYYYTNHHKVIMMNPETEEGRFDKIIYFKDRPTMDIPLELNLCGDNKERFGYGFYGKDELLPPEIQKTPPSYLPYDIYSDRLRGDKYEYIRKRSIVRFATNDFTGLNEYKEVYVVDRNPTSIPNIFDFFDKYSDKTFQFFYSLQIHSEKELNLYLPYLKQLNNRLILNYNYEPEFFAAYCDEIDKYSFNTSQRPQESNEHYLERLIKMTLLIKKKKLKMNFSFSFSNDELVKAVKQWSYDSISQKSFQEYFSGQPQENFAITAPARLRLLLKKKPLSTRSQELDFWN